MRQDTDRRWGARSARGTASRKQAGQQGQENGKERYENDAPTRQSAATRTVLATARTPGCCAAPAARRRGREQTQVGARPAANHYQPITRPPTLMRETR